MPIRSLRLLAALAGAALLPSTGAAQRPAPLRVGPPPAGVYGCTQSVYSGGTYEYEMRGTVTLEARGTYRYVMGKPGRWAFDAKAGRVRFTGGFLDGASAEPFGEGSRRIRIQLAGERGGRWTCSRR